MKNILKTFTILALAASLLSACEKESGNNNQAAGAYPTQVTYDAQGNPIYQAGSQGYAIYNFKDGKACGSEVQNNFYNLRVSCVQNIQTCAQLAEEFKRTYPLINCYAPMQRSSGYFQNSENRNDPNTQTSIHVFTGRIDQLRAALIHLLGLQ